MRGDGKRGRRKKNMKRWEDKKGERERGGEGMRRKDMRENKRRR